MEGLRLIPNFISAEEEKQLLEATAAAEWCYDLKRRTAHYGFQYDYKMRNATVPKGDLPEWQTDVLERIKNECDGFMFNQLILNEYEIGQGISKHIDHPTAFGNTIVSLSLGSGTTMVFRRGETVIPLFLPPRSLVILQGAARYEWTHEIPARKSDTVDGSRVPRGRRVSMTYRRMIRGD